MGTIHSTGQFGGRLGGLDPLKKSGEPVMKTSTGPRLSDDRQMRTSAEAYLRGSDDVS